MNLLSINNRFIVAPYVSNRTLTASGPTGSFSMVSQKVNLVGLTLLADVRQIGQRSIAVEGISQSGSEIIPKGSTVYVKEALLYTQQWAKELYECDSIEGKFMIIDQQFIEFVRQATVA
jgi:hypothetical protein